MPIFYDWKDRTGKEGIRPLREQIKELRSPVFIIMGGLLLILIACSVLDYIKPQQQTAETEKVYLLPDPPDQKASVALGTGHLLTQKRETNDRPDLDSMYEGQPENLSDTEDFPGHSSTVITNEVEPESAMPLVTSQEENVVTEPTMAELEALTAETDRLLMEGEMIRQRAIDTLGRAMPMLVNHLNNLSGKKRQDFLDQVKSQQELYAQDPSLANKGYETFLEKLRENGLEP